MTLAALLYRSSNRPVVTTGRPPMTDVGGSAAIYIDPADPADAIGAIASALSERERWRRASLDNATRFSTQAMTDAYVRCYHAAMALDVLRREPQPPSAEGLGDEGSKQKRESN